MCYASVGILAVIHHVIVNYDIFRRRKRKILSNKGVFYSYFLDALLIYYISDLTWPFAAESGNRFFAYADTCLFFSFMALSVLLWTRYVVAFLGRKGMRSNILMGAGWLIFAFVIVQLILNSFTPTIFAFDEDMKYITGTGREILLYAQVLMFASVSVYSFAISRKTKGKEKTHHMAVFSSGAVMAVFIGLQITTAYMPYYTMGCIIANTLIRVFVEDDKKRENDRIRQKAQEEKEVYSQIASGLTADYTAIYYINIESGKYIELSATDEFKSENIPQMGENFYVDSVRSIIGYVHHDDREFAKRMLTKEAIKGNFEGRKTYNYKYRIMHDGESRYYNFQCMLSEDRQSFVLCVKDINDTITAETELHEEEMKRITFSQIAESLASNYDVIYYVDVKSGSYVGYTTKDIYGELEVEESGDSFFKDAKESVEQIIHPRDRKRMLTVINKDYMLAALDRKKQLIYQYRLIVDDSIQHTRLLARKTADGKHIIIGVENVENEFKRTLKREKEYLRALNNEKELARRDELTGIRNKTAFAELENSIQEDIDSGMDGMQFAIVVCDLNNLKKVNDTLGHQAGDEYLQAASGILCDTFAHSPVYRIGGDEFTIFLKDRDFKDREKLMASVHAVSVANRDKGEGPIIAAGMAEFNASHDDSFKAIFDRADQLMYEDKRELKKN